MYEQAIAILKRYHLCDRHQVRITFSVSGKTMTLDEIFTQDEERKAALAHQPITPLKEG